MKSMKSLFSAVTVIVSLVGLDAFARSPMYDPYQNIVNITIPYGTSNSLYQPLYVKRPVRGSLLRVSMPTSCGSTTISQIALWGQTMNGQRVQLPAVGYKTEAIYGQNRFYYEINGGRPATVREIGMLATTMNVYGCTIAFEQVPVQGPIQPIEPNECNENTFCPAHIDTTYMCEARPQWGGAAVYREYRDGADNSCTIAQRLKRQICAAGQLPSQFVIRCE